MLMKYQFCARMKERYIYCRGKSFSKDNFKVPHAKLLILDDLDISLKKCREILKALVSSERVNLIGKWLNLDFHHGYPTIIITNEMSTYEKLRESAMFQEDIWFFALDGPMCPLGIDNGHDGTIVESMSLEKVRELHAQYRSQLFRGKTQKLPITSNQNNVMLSPQGDLPFSIHEPPLTKKVFVLDSDSNISQQDSSCNCKCHRSSDTDSSPDWDETHIWFRKTPHLKTRFCGETDDEDFA